MRAHPAIAQAALYANDYSTIPTIGTLFFLNFVAAWSSPSD